MPVSTVRVILLTALFALAQAKVVAQSASVSTYSYLDTLRAVEHLFAAKRTGGKIYLGVGLPVTLVGASSAFLITTLVTTIKLGKGKENLGPIIIASSGVGLLPTGIGFVRRIRFSRRNEQAILRFYRESKLLPRRVKRQLRPKYFW